ncbi:hypothetical protein Tco_0543421 [Tanacetum coccineum]
MTYRTFYPEQRIEFYSLNNVSVLPNNTAYSVNSIQRTGVHDKKLLKRNYSLLLKIQKQKFRSRRRLFDTPSLVESNSLEFDHNFDIEEQSKEEVRETMMETMEQYRARPEEITANQTIRNEKIKKVNEKVYAAQVGYELCKGPHYTKDYPQKEEGKTLEEAYYTQFGAPYQPGGQYRAAGPGFYQRNNGNSSYPDRRPSLEESLTKFIAESAKRHEENSNIIKEI